MRKKSLCALALAAVLVMMPTIAGAAPSPSGSGGSQPSVGTSTTIQSQAGASSGTVVTTGPVLEVSSDGSKTTVVEKGTDKTGTTISLVVDIATSAGVDVVANKDGHVEIGDAVISIATDVAETAGLPQVIVDTINKLNTNNDITIVAPDKRDFVGVGGTRAIISKNKDNVDVKAEITMKVDTLVGAGEILVVYYNNNTGKWEIALVRRFDPTNGLVTFDVPGSVTVKFAKKR